LSAPTLSPSNALGAKGAGEAGTTGGLVVLMNAVCDALNHCGIEDFQMPATAHRIWEAIHGVRGTTRPERHR
jgi:carbon-monoxide dehydrogenase large subunit